MKQGFFLLEALSASLMLFLLVGVIMHHYGQWTRSHRSVINQKNALAELITILEQGKKGSPESVKYVYSENFLSCGAPTPSLILPPSVRYPHVHLREVTLSWQEVGNELQSISIVTGDL